MIFDCHTHWGEHFQKLNGSDPSHWLEPLDQYGVTHAFVLPYLGLTHGRYIAQNNDEISAACANSKGRMLGFCTVNTWFRDESLAELRRCFDTLSFRGIKFHPWLQGTPINSDAMDEVCELAAHYRAPILFHDGTPPFSLPSQVALLARRHPKAQLILGHCGMLEHWREAISALNSAENVWGCLCSPHLAGIRELIAHCDTDRLLWGSDCGFIPGDFFAYRLRMMDLPAISDQARQKIFSDNPARLMNIQ